MTREEDLIRSTTRAVAATVREVPPLRLEPSADELRSGAGGSRGAARAGGPRRWQPWLAPLAAAAVVVALALSLVLVKVRPNGGAVPVNRPTAGPGGTPRYYAALRQLAGDFYSPSQRNDVVVGDSLTGSTVATIEPPAHTAFESITAAADDRTFVIFALTSSTGFFQPVRGRSQLTGSWYAVRLAPGTAEPARLTRLPIKPLPEPDPSVGMALGSFADTRGTVLSASGRELAVPVSTAQNGLTVRVFSVATGRLLHQWATQDQSVALEPSLTWIDGDRKLALLSRSTLIQPHAKFQSNDVTVREWPVEGPASGDLVRASKVVWNLPTVLRKNTRQTTVQACTEPVVSAPVVISADGTTFSCAIAGGPYPSEPVSFRTYPLAASTTATAPGTLDYQAVLTGQGRYALGIGWASPSGQTLIGVLFPVNFNTAAALPRGLRVGVICGGKFAPLPVPASLARSTVTAIAF